MQALLDQTAVRRYGVSVLTVAVGLASRLMLEPSSEETAPLFLMALSVTLGAWFGGFSPGLLATGLGVLTAMYLFIPPIYSFQVADRKGWFLLAVFALQGVFISAFSEGRRRSERARFDAQACLARERKARAEAETRSRETARLIAHMNQFASALNFFEESELANGAPSPAVLQALQSYLRLLCAPPGVSAVDVEAILGKTLDKCRAAIQENGAIVTHDPLPAILGDSAQLALLFEQLIGNAIKFRREQTPRIHISGGRHGDGWLFRVSDNGMGITLERREEIFLPFIRLHGDKYPGTGLGLASCKCIVENHGGRIWVDSTPGGGTTFRFQIGRPPNSRFYLSRN